MCDRRCTVVVALAIPRQIIARADDSYRENSETPTNPQTFSRKSMGLGASCALPASCDSCSQLRAIQPCRFCVSECPLSTKILWIAGAVLEEYLRQSAAHAELYSNEWTRQTCSFRFCKYCYESCFLSFSPAIHFNLMVTTSRIRKKRCTHNQT